MTPVVVIGAGPYGLSTTAHLRGRGLDVRTFGSPMASWREQMPAGMRLKSTPSASSMSAPAPGHTLAAYLAETGLPALGEHDTVPVEQFVDYGMWFQSRLVSDVEQVRVASLDEEGGRFHLKLDSGEELETAKVVVASGLTGFAHVPEELRALEPGLVTHSSEHADLTPFAGRDVVVVGAGQSALETAALLHEAGASVRILARREVRWGGDPTQGRRLAPDTCLGPSWALYAFANLAPTFRFLPAETRLHLVKRVLGPLGSWWLRDRVVGGVPITPGTRLLGARESGGKVLLATASGAFTADHVIAATGYQVNLDALDFLGSGVRARLARAGGFPRLNGGFESSVPGLYFTGLPAAASFGPLLRFVCGTEFASPRLAGALAATLR
ncbi:NAD(P)-binding domain-containing protein [Sphaerisporangium perillae]|uniref:NAD(P)-binding domain-containing protein n=1 Tax=Sphaerisporangium perillae TaxID=2935860 RepID=UPI00200F106A|nr:NAD(P)-binding domain-containing protein [Sphaerisporangium perillae]